MQQFIIPVNNEALSRALVAVVGEATAKTVVDAYQAIDKAMAFGFEQGQKEAEEKSKMQAKEDFNKGFDAGAASSLGSQGGQDAYDDGYIDGVSDARKLPAFADEEVARLCQDDSFDGSLVIDSGDENDCWDYTPSEYTPYDENYPRFVPWH